MLILPGNHDVNVVDRANPARLDLPFSPAKTLRKMRALSAMAAFGADRLRVMSNGAAEPGLTLAAALGPQREAIAAFADLGGLRLSNRLARFWDDQFPMICRRKLKTGSASPSSIQPARKPFLLHQRAGIDWPRQGRRLGGGHRPISKGALHHRGPPPPHRIPHAGRGVLGTGWYGAGQRELVCPQARRVRWPRRCHARPSAYSLHWRGAAPWLSVLLVTRDGQLPTKRPRISISMRRPPPPRATPSARSRTRWELLRHAGSRHLSAKVCRSSVVLVRRGDRRPSGSTDDSCRRSGSRSRSGRR